ncbi:hypothetical protein COSO111634_08400 [Corallococcus soli]
MASSEWPPSAKKSSCKPTDSTRSNCPHSPASSTSVGVPGATKPCSARGASGTGSAARSTLPLGVSGSASSTITTDGTIDSGNRRRACSRTADSTSGCPGFATT